jgi:membrane associated rhomboid family serine protease
MGGSRNNGSLVLQVGFVLLIGLSGVLVSIQAGSGPRFALLAGVGGLVVGAVVTWLVVRNLREVMPDTPDMSDREW